MHNTPPPIKTPMVDDRGFPTREWHRWFQKIGFMNDPVKTELHETHTTSTSLSDSDWGKVIIFNIGSTDANCDLMTIKLSKLYNWVRIVRLGTGKLTITAPTGVRIEYGSYGGRIWCDEQRRAAANITLQSVSLTQLAIIGATGIWRVR